MRNRRLFTPFIFLLLLGQFFLLPPTYARWATVKDAPAEIEIYNSDITVDKDGKSEEIVEKQIKILNETGRNAFSAERLQYNENIEKIEIIEAKTIIDGKAFIVPKDMIEIKPLASEIRGFDQLFQVLISYPHVSSGSKVYLKYKITTFKQPLPNYFSFKFYLGQGAYWKNVNVKIKSEIPFFHLVNNPNSLLTISIGKDGKYYTLKANSKKPIYDDLMNEPLTNQIPESLRTCISISTFDSNEAFSKASAIDYETVLKQELPPLQASIKNAAAKISNPVDLINCVTSQLSEKIRYMGDWRTIEGKFSPRSLKAVADSGVGDCKDFSASTAAILNALGFKAQVALVMRGVAYLPPEKSLPSFYNSNHAIVKATSKDGQVFWIDPTNFTSMADGIYPDISDRPVLVLDSRTPSYEKIPSINPQHAKMIIKERMEIKENDILKTEGDLTLTGERAQPVTGAALTHSLQIIEEGIIQSLSGETSPLSPKLTLPSLNSRIVKDVFITYSYVQENHLLLTNLGPAILLHFSWADNLIDTSPSQEGTTFVGLPMTQQRKISFPNMDAEQAKTLTFEIKSPWVEARRECKAGEIGFEMIEEITVLKSFISAEEIRSKMFQDLRQALKKYASKLALVISNLPKEPVKKRSDDPLAKSQ